MIGVRAGSESGSRSRMAPKFRPWSDSESPAPSSASWDRPARWWRPSLARPRSSSGRRASSTESAGNRVASPIRSAPLGTIGRLQGEDA